MTEQEEGLEAGKILDDLEMEVPTAAFELIKGLENGETTAFYYGYNPRTSLSGGIYEEVNELVRREDHEEALREAVKGARQRERRRTLNKIEKVFSDMDKALQDYQQSSDRVIPYMVKTILDNHKEELEEEVR